MGMTIINLWKLFRYGDKTDHYYKLVGIREFSEQLSIDCFNNPLTTDTATMKKNPLLGYIDNGKKVSTFRSIHFTISISRYTQGSAIYELTLISDSLSASNLVAYTIGSQNNT